MKNKLFDALDFLADSTKAHDHPTLFSFVKNEIESILDNLDDVEYYRDVELVLERWCFDCVVYYRDSSAIFFEKNKNGDAFDEFLLEMGYYIDGNFSNDTSFDKVALIFANYMVEQEAAKKCKNLITRCWDLERLQKNKTNEYAELIEHIRNVLRLTEAEELKTMREVFEAYTDKAQMSTETRKLLEIMVLGSTVWRYSKTLGPEMLS